MRRQLRTRNSHDQCLMPGSSLFGPQIVSDSEWSWTSVSPWNQPTAQMPTSNLSEVGSAQCMILHGCCKSNHDILDAAMCKALAEESFAGKRSNRCRPGWSAVKCIAVPLVGCHVALGRQCCFWPLGWKLRCDLHFIALACPRQVSLQML